MALIAYPSTLPAPAPGLSLAPAERRALAQQGNPLARARARDFGGSYSANWTYTPAQMAAWVDWYENTCRRTLWFSCPLHGAGGYITRVVRYLSLTKTFLGAGIWRVNAELQLRGASVAPGADNVIFRDEFDGAGSIVSHAPSVAPAGFAWSNVAAGLTLTGGTAISASASNDGGAIGPVVATLPAVYRLYFTGGRSALTGVGVESCTFKILDAGGMYTEIGFSASTSQFKALSRYDRLSGLVEAAHVMAPGIHELVLTVEPTQMTLNVNGADQLVTTIGALSSIAQVEIKTSVDSGVYCPIHRVALIA